MKSKLLVSAMVVAMGLLSASSMAQSSSGKTRAQVTQEMEIAKRDGSYPVYVWEDPVVIKSPAVGMTRQQVKYELIQAQNGGSFSLHDGEEARTELYDALAGTGEINLAPTAFGTRTRKSVMDELFRDQAVGGLPKHPEAGL